MGEPATGDDNRPQGSPQSGDNQPGEVAERGGDLVPLRPHEQAIVSAAEAALDPARTIPGRDEFLAMAMMARVLSMSSIVGKDLRGKPADVFVILLTGRDLGIPLTAALRKVYVVDGQPSIAPLLLNARIRQLGLGSIVRGPADNFRAVAVALGPSGVLDLRCRPTWPNHVDGCDCRNILGDAEFSWEDAQGAGLVDERCQPREHTRSGGRCKCKDNWKHYPARMLWWRAAGYLADDYFPEASLGLYSPDELGALTDQDGNPIDPATVALPEGYEKAGQAVQQEEPADRLLLLDLGLRIRALPDEQQAEIREAFKERELPPVRLLTPSKLKVVDPLVRAYEAKVRNTGDCDLEERYRACLADFAAEYAAAADTEAPPPAPPAPPATAAAAETAQTAQTAQTAPEAPPAPAEPDRQAAAAERRRPLVDTTEEDPCPFCSSHPCECWDETTPEAPAAPKGGKSYAPGEEPF